MERHDRTPISINFQAKYDSITICNKFSQKPIKCNHSLDSEWNETHNCAKTPSTSTDKTRQRNDFHQCSMETSLQSNGFHRFLKEKHDGVTKTTSFAQSIETRRGFRSFFKYPSKEGRHGVIRAQFFGAVGEHAGTLELEPRKDRPR